MMAGMQQQSWSLTWLRAGCPDGTTKWHVPLLRNAVGYRAGQSSPLGAFLCETAIVSTLFKFLWGFLSLNSKMTKKTSFE